MRVLLAGIVSQVLFFAAFASAYAAGCGNPGGQVFHPTPPIAAPDTTRTVGFTIGGPLRSRPVPDPRPECLPLALRLNNPGALKTPRAGPWAGQIDKDSKGHAVFATVEDGVSAWLTWMRRRIAGGTDTPFRIMSMYAPPDDCIGSQPKLPNGQCPPRYPLNPTAEYAKLVAEAAGVGINERITLRGGAADGALLRAMLRTIIQFEIGRRFCDGGCDVTDATFEAAIARS